MKRLIAAGVAALAVTAITGFAATVNAESGSDPSADVLTVDEAKIAARYTVEQMAVPFTEREPRISVRCTVRQPTMALCDVILWADRLDARVRVRVTHGPTGYTMYASKLRVYDSRTAVPLPSERAR